MQGKISPLTSTVSILRSLTIKLLPALLFRFQRPVKHAKIAEFCWRIVDEFVSPPCPAGCILPVCRKEIFSIQIGSAKLPTREMGALAKTLEHPKSK